MLRQAHRLAKFQTYAFPPPVRLAGRATYPIIRSIPTSLSAHRTSFPYSTSSSHFARRWPSDGPPLPPSQASRSRGSNEDLYPYGSTESTSSRSPESRSRDDPQHSSTISQSDPSVDTEIPTQPSIEAESQPQSSEPEVADTLPDLRQGIPSTLAAELEKAQNRGPAHKESLNITEDPNEPIVESGRGGEGGPPRIEYVSSSDRRKNAAFRYTYGGLLLAFVGYSAYLGRNWENEEETRRHANAPNGWGMGLFYNRVKARLTSTLTYYSDPVTTKLLPDEDKDPNLRFPFVLVVSLEDLLIHEEWSREHGWRVAKRPGMDYFLRYLSQYYEIVLFTSKPYALAEQVVRKMDPFHMIQWPLFREATLYKDGGYVKDISYLNRPLNKVLAVDTDSHHYINQPENAIIIPPWKGDPQDQTLVQLIPFLEYLATMGLEDVRPVLKSFEGKEISVEFARREKLLRQKFEAQQTEQRGTRPKRKISLGSVFNTRAPNPDGLQGSAEAGGEGKMIWDQIRERGQKQYEALEKRIQEEGPKWLAEQAAEQKRLEEEAMKDMKKGFFGYFRSGNEPERPLGST